MTMSAENNINKLGIVIPEAPAKGGLYTPCVNFGGDDKLVYVSGCGPNLEEATFSGKLGKDYTIEEGQVAAKNAMLNSLAILKASIGNLDKVKKVVKILVFVASEDDFYSQPQVANGASQVLMDIFGDLPARSAIGVNVLPGNIPVEIEAVYEIV